MDSGVTTSLKEARVAREHSHRLLLHEKHSKKDVSGLLSVSADTPISILICLWGEVLTVYSLGRR